MYIFSKIFITTFNVEKQKENTYPIKFLFSHMNGLDVALEATVYFNQVVHTNVDHHSHIDIVGPLVALFLVTILQVVQRIQSGELGTYMLFKSLFARIISTVSTNIKNQMLLVSQQNVLSITSWLFKRYISDVNMHVSYQ